MYLNRLFSSSSILSTYTTNTLFSTAVRNVQFNPVVSSSAGCISVLQQLDGISKPCYTASINHCRRPSYTAISLRNTSELQSTCSNFKIGNPSSMGATTSNPGNSNYTSDHPENMGSCPWHIRKYNSASHYTEAVRAC